MVADNDSVVEFRKEDDIADPDAGKVFRKYTEDIWAVPLFSNIKIQCRDTTAYPEQLRRLKRFIADFEDEYNRAQRDKVGQPIQEVERVDAHLCFTISGMVRAINAEINSVNSLAKRFPILIQKTRGKG